MTHILNADELKDLTGTDSKLKQKRKLSKSGIGFVEHDDGTPATTWEAVNDGLNRVNITGSNDIDWGAMENG